MGSAVVAICCAMMCSALNPTQLQCAPGALASGQFLRVANLTIADAVDWCTNDSSCAGFTTRSTTCDATKDVSIHKLYFKTTLGGNGDPSWRTWQKENFTAPLFYCQATNPIGT